jgi:guanylate kinase
MQYAIIIAGPSGAGKTTVADTLIERLGNLEMSRSATTRVKRGDGRDAEYIYLTPTEFAEAVKSGDMVEYTEYSGNMYGTRRCELARILNEGKYPILVLDYNGVRSLKERLPYPVYAFYIYSSLSECERRLRYRDSQIPPEKRNPALITSRCATNKEDYSLLHTMAPLFDAYVENAELDVCVGEIVNCLEALKSGVPVMSNAKKAEITALFKKWAEEN